jgi:hypothetical protein
MYRRLMFAAALASAAALSGCVAYPSGPSTILSRLPASSPEAAPSRPAPLTKEEQQRYDRIDKQVLRDQQRAMDAEAAARAAAGYYEVTPIPVYGGYPAYYGGYPAYYGDGGYGYYSPVW